ncbi:MAG: HAD-IIB family hydrolase, partial [Streptococcus sp.]|nr:HAD-IIB family hydrolase [Streptococcus sp.]
RAEDKYALADEMNRFYQHQLAINTWGGPLNILECTPKGVNKAFALEYLLNVMNRDKKDLIAFGDEHNDTEMLAFAGKGYAMKNANPALLPYADEQLPLTNEEDGVAYALQNLFL